jgi:hypothetical protein
VILRVVHGRVPVGQLVAVRGALERDYVPAANACAGLVRYIVATRPATEAHDIVMLTVWADVDSALAAYAGDLAMVGTLDGIGHGEILDHVDYYEVDDGEAHRRPGEPRFLRLSSGSVGHGLDADIQRDLREHLADLGPDVVDVYVGRRVKGASVEIAFASAWAGVPAGAALDAPIWPHLSSFFDTFGIHVYDVLLHGTPRT